MGATNDISIRNTVSSVSFKVLAFAEEKVPLDY
jgi:hypothetical protein